MRGTNIYKLPNITIPCTAQQTNKDWASNNYKMCTIARYIETK